MTDTVQLVLWTVAMVLLWGNVRNAVRMMPFSGSRPTAERASRYVAWAVCWFVCAIMLGIH